MYNRVKEAWFTLTLIEKSLGTKLANRRFYDGFLIKLDILRNTAIGFCWLHNHHLSHILKVLFIARNVFNILCNPPFVLHCVYSTVRTTSWIVTVSTPKCVAHRVSSTVCSPQFTLPCGPPWVVQCVYSTVCSPLCVLYRWWSTVCTPPWPVRCVPPMCTPLCVFTMCTPLCVLHRA